MADDVTVDNGSLTDYTVATDDVAGKQYQRVKLDVGGDGASVPVEGEMPVGGDVAHDAVDSGNPVKIGGYGSGTAPTPVSANGDRVNAWFSQRGDLRTSLVAPSGGVVQSDTDDWDDRPESGDLGLRVIANPLMLNGTEWVRQRGDITNGLDVDVTRVSGTVNVADGGGSLTVDGTVTVNALPAGTANIGDVDVLTVPSPLSTAGNGTAAAAHRVTIASDSTGVIAVTDNGGSLTVDGTVAVTNAGLTELAAAIDTEMQVDVVGALPAGTNNIGDVDIASALPAGDNNIGNVDVVTMPTVTVQDGGGSLTVDGTVGVTGTFWQATQPVSGTVTANAGTGPFPVSDNGGSLTVDGTFWQATQPVSAVSLPFPTDSDLSLTPGLTALKDQLVAERYTVIADSIADGLNAYWTQTNANGGTTTSSGGEGLIQTSANAAGSAQIVSPTMDYHPGQVNWLNSAIRLGDTGNAGNIRRWGAFTVSGVTPQEGYYYELSATTLNAVVVKAGTPTAVASTSWSKFATAPFTLDTNYHQFEIRYTANTVWFLIDNVLRHVVSGTTAPITTTLNFPIALHSINTSGATNRLIGVRNIGMGRFGQKPSYPQVATTSTVAGSASSVQLLNNNGGRKGATIYNDSTALLYVKLGTTASTSDFTVKMQADQYYEVPFGYTGKIDGIWASATGNARLTELV
jgi:hypothetical protein